MVRKQGYQLGIKEEVKASKWFHRDQLVLLVDPGLLRSMGLGQIDLSRALKNKVEILEVKSSSRLNRHQYLRIRNTQQWLSYILGMPVFMEVHQSKIISRQEETSFLT